MSIEWSSYCVEEFSSDEQRILTRYFTNIDQPVFCLINLPEVVKGALYARYSRTSKSTRRLFLDEFVNRKEIAIKAMTASMAEVDAIALWEADPSSAFQFIANHLDDQHGDPIFSIEHAESLYRRVFDEYGDDSVSQLGGVHIVFEQASNVVINEIEWGRLAAYLEQSTRYIDYSTRQPDGRYRYFVPNDVVESPSYNAYIQSMDRLFEIYTELLSKAIQYFTDSVPRSSFAGDDRAYNVSIRAKAFDTVRPVLPAGVVSNVGFFGSAQAAANMIRRLLSSDLTEARLLGEMALKELRHPDSAPAFFNQIDDPKKGTAWLDYFKETRSSARSSADSLIAKYSSEKPAHLGQSENEVELAWADPENQRMICAGILYELNSSGLTMWECYEHACLLDVQEQSALIASYSGERGSLESEHGNRRWKPGRAFEMATYNFDMLIDFGSMRDWKRHRMLTAMWGKLTDQHGWTVSTHIGQMGGVELYEEAMHLSSKLYQLVSKESPNSAQYAICLAYRMRFMFNINARALMFMLELRTSQQGHPSYRRVGQQMHHLVSDVDPLIAAAMTYVDHNEYELERGSAEMRLSEKRANSAD